jgi:hypothetical protein
MPRPRALYLDKWDSGQRNQPSPVRDRLVDLVERRPGISQAEAGRILNRNVSLTVKAAVAGGLLRRQSREDRIDSWLLFPQEEWQPTDPRNPAERPNRQLWVLELMGRAGRELTVREVLARARKVDQRITRPAVVGALRSLLHNQAATRRAVGGRFVYAPVRGALTRARLLVGADPAGFAYPRMM